MAQQNLRHEDYLTAFLGDPQKALAYLNEFFHDDGEGDYELLLCRAMRNVIRAQGFAQVSTKAQVGRESLYKSFSDHGDPRMSTLLKVLHSLGFGISLTLLPPKMTAKPAPARRKSATSAKGRPVRRSLPKASKQAARG